jgi:hypothetical protein
MTPAEKAAAAEASEQAAALRRERLIAAQSLPYDEMIAESDRIVLEEAGW